MEDSEADEPAGAELRSVPPPEISLPVPAEDLLERSLSAGESGGAELRSFAPLEVSLPPGFEAAGGLKAPLLDFLHDCEDIGVSIALSSRHNAANIARPDEY